MTKPTKNKILQFIAISVLIAIFFVFDRYLKLLAIRLGELGTINLIGDFFYFKLVKNPYIAFSIPLNPQISIYLISLLTLALIGYTLYALIKKNLSKAQLIFLTLISFGAINNLVDRFQFAYVIDYFNIANLSAFNLADSLILIGIIGLVVKKDSNLKI